MSDLRLEDLKRFAKCANGDLCSCKDVPLPVTPSEVASVLSDADLLGELVRRGVLTEDVHYRLHYPTTRFVTKWREDTLIGESK